MLQEVLVPRILLCSGEPILARGLESVLRQVDSFDLLPSCATLAGLQEQLAINKPEVLLLDLSHEVTFSVLSDLKHAAPETSIVLWVTAISTELAFQAMGLGVRGILRKQLPAELQVKCLQRVHAGELWFEKALTDSFLNARRVVLTNREGQLVSLLSQGLKNKEIAATLMVSEGTVKVYLSRLFEKAGVKDRFELALFGLRNLTTGQQPPAPNGQSYGRRSVRGLRSLLLERRAEPSVEVHPRLAPVRSPVS
jgi:DNA-binding NarL/FixJ family response regulator